MDNDDKIFPAEFLPLTAEYHFQKYSPSTNIIYRLVLAFVLLALGSIFFIKINVNVRSIGTVKSPTEHNEIKSLVSGRVDSLFISENQHVVKGQVLAKLKAQAINQQDLSTQSQQTEFAAQRADLEQLAAIAKNDTWNTKPNLTSSLYSQQYVELKAQAAQAENNLDVAERNDNRYNYLYNSRAISGSEYDAVHLTYQNAKSALHLIYDTQGSKWQADLNDLKAQMRNLQSQGMSIQQEKDLYTIRAPVTGTVQNLRGVQPGSVVAANDILAEISPETGMIAEVYVLPKDVGMIRPGTKVNFQVEAFNYNEWGLLSGKVSTVSNDVFTDNGQQPYFKVRCKLDKDELHLKNGYVGHIKKGMSIQANFLVARRTLFQLLYDQADDWLNPSQIKKQDTASKP